MGLVAWAGGAVAWAGGCGGVGKWLWWHGSGGFNKSLPFSLSLSLSLFSLESSLHGSHSLVGLMGLMWWQMWQIRAVPRWCIDVWWLCY